jgi:hypothetical protein
MAPAEKDLTAFGGEFEKGTRGHMDAREMHLREVKKRPISSQSGAVGEVLGIEGN